MNVTVNVGEQSKIVMVTVNSDTTAEGVETFKVTLTPPGGLTVAKGVGTGTILDNE